MRAGHEVWCYDNLSTGHRQAVPSGRLIVGDLMDRVLLEATLRERRIDAVMHFAAFSLVGESVSNPGLYYQNNLAGSLSLLEAMRAANVTRLVFSSTTATYGNPARVPISEDTPQRPINPYGFTKLAVEQALADYAQAYGFAYAALRYFNAAGASPDGAIGEDHAPETHLIPLVLQAALGQRAAVHIFGEDYPTPDGTCIRDYIHVDDLGQAHLQAIERLVPGDGLLCNLGIGRGYSVREVIDACQRVTGREIRVAVGPRRAGDPTQLVADASRARQLLDWQPAYTSLEQIVDTAWQWHRNHPHGYQTERTARSNAVPQAA